MKETALRTLHAFAEEPVESNEANEARAARLAAETETWTPQEILREAIERQFPGRIALVSSFGAESAVLLHMAAQVDPNLPVIFLDTHMHFAQTLEYRNELAARLGLTNFRNITPDPEEVAGEDPKSDLWRRDSDACCALRKVRPNARALEGFDAWISGRKRHHGGPRALLPVFEHDRRFFKVNPLATWTPKDIAAYFRANDLPAHPLVAQGFPSIGCWPCTQPSAERNSRAGRWAGANKTECGIHLPLPAPRQQAF
jgi:phosphoadenosine phosphosulfate reductase